MFIHALINAAICRKRELHIYLIMIWKTKDVFENTDG